MYPTPNDLPPHILERLDHLAKEYYKVLDQVSYEFYKTPIDELYPEGVGDINAAVASSWAISLNKAIMEM